MNRVLAQIQKEEDQQTEECAIFDMLGRRNDSVVKSLEGMDVRTESETRQLLLRKYAIPRYMERVSGPVMVSK